MKGGMKYIGDIEDRFKNAIKTIQESKIKYVTHGGSGIIFKIKLNDDATSHFKSLNEYGKYEEDARIFIL